MRRPAPHRVAIALALTLMFAAAPLLADTVEAEWNSGSPGKLLRYAGCALAVATTAAGVPLVLALMGCSIIIADEVAY